MIPVNSEKENVVLRDFIPYQNNAFEITTDNSSDFGDDFSIAESVIEIGEEINDD